MWFFYLALKQLFPSGRRFPFFTLMSIAGVALGVTVLVVVTSVMGGWGYQLRQMIVETEGEVQVKANGAVGDVAKALEEIRKAPVVAAATPYVAAPVGVIAAGHPAFPILRGVDPDTVESVANLKRFIIAGSLDALDDDSVILGVRVAGDIGARVGDQIEIYSPLVIEKLKNDEVMLPRTFRVAGVLEMGHQHLDSSTIYGTLRTAQEIFGMGAAVGGINVRLKAGVSDDDGAAALNRVLPRSLHAYSWVQSWQDFLFVLNLEKMVNLLILFIIVIIASFSVMSSLLISVVRKTREIGLLGALGGRPRDIALCFCAQAFIIGVSGTVLGLGGGFGILAIRNPLVHGLARAFGREETLEEFYQFSNLPSHTFPGDLVFIVVAAIVVSTLAGLLPAWRAARLKPVEALRSE